MFYQQGDVLIKKVDSIPDNVKKIESKNGRLILAEGEATGHAHAIIDTPEINLFEKDGKLWLSAGKDCNISHEEHKPFIIEKGDYEIGIVQEYDHFLEEARKVED